CLERKIRIDHRILGKRLEILQLQKIGEEPANALIEPRRSDQPVDLSGKTGVSAQLSLLSRRQQLVIRKRVPQKQTEARCKRIIVETIVTRPVGIGLARLCD